MAHVRLYRAWTSTWIDPEAGKVPLADYASSWLADRPDLRPRTKELYRSLLRLHILPRLGSVELGDITPAKVRSWRAGLLEAGHPGVSTIAKAYRLLHAICATALEDSLITRNPCVIKGASVERPNVSVRWPTRPGRTPRALEAAPIAA